MAHSDSSPSIPSQRPGGADRLEIPVDSALSRLDDLLAHHDTSCGVLVFAFGGSVEADHVTIASRRLRGALATMRRVWSPLRATLSTLPDDRFLVIVDGLPDTVPAATFALALRYETCSALRGYDERVAEIFCVGVAIPGEGADTAVDLVRRAEVETAAAVGADMQLSG